MRRFRPNIVISGLKPWEEDSIKLLRIGGVPDGAPYYKKSLTDGSWQGFYIDICKKLADDLRLELSVLETTWGNSVLDLQADKVDVFFGLNPTPERQKVNGRRFMAAIEARKLLPGLHGMSTLDYDVDVSGLVGERDSDAELPELLPRKDIEDAARGDDQEPASPKKAP